MAPRGTAKYQSSRWLQQNNINMNTKKTDSPSMMPSTEPSKSPTQAPVIITASPITPAPSSAPTRLPYLHDASSRIVGTLDSFLVSLYSPEISLQVQESTLTDILNLALCSISGVQLVTTELEPVPACGTISGGHQGQGQEQGQRRALAEYDNENTDNDEHAMVVWNVPLAQATWQWLEYLEDGRMSLSLLNSTTNTTTLEYVQWNLTYRVLQFGTTSSTATAMPHMLQELWNQSITSGRLDTALQNEWPHTTTATATSLIGNEWESFKATAISSADANNHSPMLWEVPARSVEVLRWLGVAMCVWMVLSVALVTVLARRHRQHKAMAEESSVEILFSTRPREEEEEEEKEPSDGPLYGAAAAPQEGLPSLEPTSSRGLEFMLRQSRNFVQDNPHMQRVPKSARGGGTTTNSISPSVLLLQSFDDIYDNDDDFVVTGITSTTSSNGRSVSRRSLSPRSSVRQRYIDRLSQNNHSSTYSATTTPSRDGEPSLLFHLNVEEDQEHDIAF